MEEGGSIFDADPVPHGVNIPCRSTATEYGIRGELRFNDLRGTKVTEMVWSGISVPDLAIRIGWKIETAAKMLGVYAALNPGRAMVVALPGTVVEGGATG